MKRIKQISLKLSFLALTLCLGLVLSGCGNSDSGGNYAMSNGKAETDNFVAEGGEEQVSGMEENGESDAEGETQEGSSGNTGEEQTVSKEMLVYRGSAVIDTLNFDQSVDTFKKLLDKVDGFVETESYHDDADISGYYVVEEEEKHNRYTATVRVPSSQYDTFMNDASNLGDVRSKSSNAENVTQEYGTYQSELEVYETEYKRYMKLLKDATKDAYALQIEEKLFKLQIKIADLKSNITNLETDVAYSYVDITIREVSKYQEEPVRKDTFWNRLKSTCADSWSCFLYVLEGLLFFLIRTWYYIVIIAVIILLVLRHQKKKPAKLKTTEETPREEIAIEEESSPEENHEE